MNGAMWIIFAVAWLSSMAPITQGRGDKLDEKQLRKYAEKRHLPLPPGKRSVVLAEIGRRERMILTCGVIGIVVWAVVAGVLKVAGIDYDLGPLVFAVAPIAASLGGYFATVRAPERLIPDAPRVARAVEVTNENYEPMGQIKAFWLSPVAIAVGLVGAWLVYALMPLRPAGYLFSMVAATLGAVAMFGAWALMVPARRAVVERPQHAHNDVELIWDDALRSDALYGVSGNGIVMGLLAPLISLVTAVIPLLDQAIRGADQQLGLMLGVGAFAVGLVCWLVVLVPLLSAIGNKTQFHSLWQGHRFSEEGVAC